MNAYKRRGISRIRAIPFDYDGKTRSPYLENWKAHHCQWMCGIATLRRLGMISAAKNSLSMTRQYRIEQQESGR